MLFLLDQGVTEVEETGPGTVLAKLLVQIKKKDRRTSAAFSRRLRATVYFPTILHFAVRRLQPDLRAAAADRRVQTLTRFFGRLKRQVLASRWRRAGRGRRSWPSTRSGS